MQFLNGDRLKVQWLLSFEDHDLHLAQHALLLPGLPTVRTFPVGSPPQGGPRLQHEIIFKLTGFEIVCKFHALTMTWGTNFNCIIKNKPSDLSL